MNKKAFTLVELLAVIAILALLVIIALPNIMSLFSEAKKKSFENEVRNIYKAANQQFISDSMNNSSEISYSRCSEGCSNPLRLSGRENINYYIKLGKDGKVKNFIVSDGNFQYSYSGEGLNIEDIADATSLSGSTGIEINGNGAINIATFVTRQNEGTITPGDELTIADENFYVVSSDWQETVLLSKYDLNVDNNSQDISGTNTNISKLYFANIGYWDSCNINNTTCSFNPNGLISPYGDGGKQYCSSWSLTNCAYVYDSNSLLYDYVNAYASKIGSISGTYVRGRLLALEEGNTFKNTNAASAEAIKDKNNYRYFLGTPGSYSSGSVSVVNYNGGVYYTGERHGLRPVLIISTTSL